MFTIRNDFRDAFNRIEGTELIDVSAKVGYVELVFLGEDIRIFLRVTKEFSYSFGKESLQFIPSIDAQLPSESNSGNFVFLRGRRCSLAKLESTGAQLHFGGSAMELRVKFSDSDFEPIELIGATGERLEGFAFHFV